VTRLATLTNIYFTLRKYSYSYFTAASLHTYVIFLPPNFIVSVTVIFFAIFLAVSNMLLLFTLPELFDTDCSIDGTVCDP
jgi:hypothetical protein